MPPRQVWIFRFGCWATLLAAAVHLIGHVAGHPPPSNDVERQLEDLATTYRYTLPGGTERSLTDFMNGFSLMFAVQLTAMGVLGLVIIKRGQNDAALMLAASRTLALVSIGLLFISLTHFFIVPTLFIALMAISFAVSAVRAPSA
jgi:hypothetical protein